MSWFDTSGFANIAKSALKEAQRTIDKALDIKDDEDHVSVAPTNTPIDTNSEDFFGTWGLSSGVDNADDEVITKSPTKKAQGSTSIWGSFTGSFFEPSSTARGKLPRDSVDSLDDSADIGTEHFSGSKLVVQDDGDGSFSRVNSCETDEDVVKLPVVDVDESVRRRDRSSIGATCNNRLSAVSTESDRRSSESVEILSGCTTSPESEAVSVASSALGSKPTSESVEILPNSLTSPSSVEVIPSDDLSSRRQSQQTDEFVSPLQSPDENFSYSNSEKMTPDSVEVIPDDVESLADDTTSYNSISESTATTVLDVHNVAVKPRPPLPPIKSEPEGPELPITRAPSRGGMSLPLSLIDAHGSKPNVIDIPGELDDGSQSDKTLSMESSSDTSTTTDSNANSLYLKNMLADAMTEKRDLMDLSQVVLESGGRELTGITIAQLEMPPRTSSPTSSESRSDLVKIGSDHTTSAHTSGDELETTTSSDIEIISSPNGDSSSTHSRHSPAKMPTAVGKCKGEVDVDSLLGKMTMRKIKGHNRELSEASSVSDDTELDRLVRRLAEMTDILEHRESKLVEISRRNAELQDANGDLRRQLDAVLDKQLDSAELSQVTEEYTQRLSALERKFQQAIREKDALRKQLEQCRQENAQRMSRAETEQLVGEKEQVIKELREEGEKLSKQQLQHSNIIKKLRAREKELETTIKHLKESVEDFSSEADRLKRSLTAKEEVERSQIEAVHQLTAKNKRLEHELAQLREQHDDLVQKHETTKRSLDAAKKELVDKTRTSSELVQREQMLQSLENEKRMTESQNEEIINQMEDLRSKLRDTDQEFARKELALRSENAELLRRLEDAERRNEELGQSVLEVSRPLVRQLEALQATHNMKVSTLEKAEQGLMLKLSEMQAKMSGVVESEKAFREECYALRSSLSSCESQVGTYKHECEMLRVQVEQQKAEKMILEQEKTREIESLQQKLADERGAVDSLQREIEVLQQNLLTEKTSIESEKKRNLALQEQVKERHDLMGTAARTSPPNVGNISPTLSIGRASLPDSFNSSLWPGDEAFEVTSMGRCTNMLEMQLLQTNLKQRDGEVQQLQWELNRREHERTLLNGEISNLLSRVEELESKCATNEGVERELSELRQQYETLCQLYGEKVEETEELRLDLADVKEMYKAQIDELLAQRRTRDAS